MTATGVSVERSRAGMDVYGTLRARILDLQLPPDGKLNIDALARELGVSQTPVREALNQLEGDNLIVRIPGKGYRTTALLGLSELRELFEFRLLVEPWAARAVAVNRLSNPGRRLESSLEEFTAGPAAGASMRHLLISHDTQFHDEILSASNNNFALQAYRATHCHLHLFRLHPADYSGEQTVDEHRVILNAIKDRNPDAAEDAMYQHLVGAYHRFAEAFAEQRDPALRNPKPARLC